MYVNGTFFQSVITKGIIYFLISNNVSPLKFWSLKSLQIMRTIFPKDSLPRDLHRIMLGSIAPRPIALVSSQDKDGNPNLAPFSYFNAISSTPPIIVFSVNRKPDGSKKDTLLNIESNKECVINMVNYSISHQIALAGIQFDKNINEFEKTGLNTVKSTTIQTAGVLESPVRFECTLDKIISFGDHAGASSLIICNVNCIHIDKNAFDKNNKIDPVKLDLVARLGRAFYLKTTKENIFAIPQSRSGNPLGFDNLPQSILNSDILTGNDLSKIAALEKLPSKEEAESLYLNLKKFNFGIEEFHGYAKMEINNGEIYLAASFALIPEYFLK